MLLDQYSLLAAVGFSTMALCVTLLLSWMTTRMDAYLLTWSAGLACVVVGVVLFVALGDNYDPITQCASFLGFIVGFSLIYAGALQFRGRMHRLKVAGAAMLSVGVVLYPFALGFSGIGTILGNIALGCLLLLSAGTYWSCRREAPFAMTVNTLLYALTAASFFLCAVPLIADHAWILHARPNNWAEDLNSLAAIIGLSGIGAISLAMNQARIALHHKQTARIDALTGLLNRRALFEGLGAGRIPASMAVIVLDLDHFKSINDRFGHAGGDLVLEKFAGIIRDKVVFGDLAARLGGEEFCIVMPDASFRLATRLAEDIRATFSAATIESASGTIKATVSIGVAFSAVGGESFDAILERADNALYRAKNEGRNRVGVSRLQVAA
ncbi:sensor domain-containing diguanylate cyclase [Tianweitania sediminis]|uniref:diguanylate cyclase n=1 Tax=Tianweitania sediminis TaxID=1502156 RepID=A0A8J7QZ06_9HYPH|nr:GGDEF domain-containing protein [Tianweitania sediminis]MBP0437882.1 GGDEF domain-containing protein [Tianweitania sediminis]